jgi:hypothetical protein
MSEDFFTNALILAGCGMLLHLVASFWLLFVMYREDVQMARLVVFFPVLSYVFIARNTEAAIKPCILQVIGFGLNCLAVSKFLNIGSSMMSM